MLLKDYFVDEYKQDIQRVLAKKMMTCISLLAQFTRAVNKRNRERRISLDDKLAYVFD